MKYRQLTSDERYLISKLRKTRHSVAEIARILGRHRSTIYRDDVLPIIQTSQK